MPRSASQRPEDGSAATAIARYSMAVCRSPVLAAAKPARCKAGPWSGARSSAARADAAAISGWFSDKRPVASSISPARLFIEGEIERAVGTPLHGHGTDRMRLLQLDGVFAEYEQFSMLLHDAENAMLLDTAELAMLFHTTELAVLQEVR